MTFKVFGMTRKGIEPATEDLSVILGFADVKYSSYLELYIYIGVMLEGLNMPQVPGKRYQFTFMCSACSYHPGDVLHLIRIHTS